MEHLIIEPQGAWVKITLNRPEARNALNTATLAALAEVLDGLAEDPACRAVLICGAAGNFAAGADVAEIETKTSAEAAVDPRKGHWAAIREFPKPMVAAVDGFALGGGLELAMMADCMVLGESARLGLPETSLGLIPGAGGTQRLLALIGRARATRMILSGEIIDAETAFSWGLAAWIVKGPALAEAKAITAHLAARAPLALAAAKAAIVAGDEAGRAFVLERQGFERLMDSADKAEGLRAMREKRKADFRGK